MKKSLEFVEAVYDDLKGLYVATKKDLKALAERHNFQGARVDEWLLKFIIWSYIVTALMLNWSVCPRLKTRKTLCLHLSSYAPVVIVSHACRVLRTSPRGVCMFWVRHRVATLLYLVKCLLFAITMSAVFITAVVAAVGSLV